MDLYSQLFPYTPEDTLDFIRDDPIELIYIKIEKIRGTLNKFITHLLMFNPNSKRKMMWMFIKLEFNISGVIIYFPDFLKVLEDNFKEQLRGFLYNILLKIENNQELRNRTEFLSYPQRNLIDKGFFFTMERESPGFSNHLVYLSHIKRYLWASEFCKNKIVMDAGCGMGFGSKLISKFSKNVYAFDISSDAILSAKKLYNAPNILWETGDLCCLDIEDKQFDIIISFDVIEHLERKKISIFLKEMYRLLKPDGLFLISTPNKEYTRGRKRSDFHLSEMNIEEFHNCLTPVFKKGVSLFGQRGYTGNLEIEQEFNITQEALKLDDTILAICKK